jgi:hypothetical protein
MPPVNNILISDAGVNHCHKNYLISYFLLEPVQDLDQWMQCKAKVDEKAQHTGVCEHFESTFNAAMRHSARS